MIAINIIWELIKIAVCVLVVIGLAYVVQILALFYKATNNVTKKVPKSLCDGCKHLTRKGGAGLYQYYCSMSYTGFDKPPEYCKYYEERGE